MELNPPCADCGADDTELHTCPPPTQAEALERAQAHAAAATEVIEDMTRAREATAALTRSAAVRVLSNGSDLIDVALTSCGMDSAETALRYLRDLRAARVRLAEQESIVETLAAKLMGRDHTFEAPDLYALRRGGASRKAWDHPALISRVASNVGLVVSTGPDGVPDDDLRDLVRAAVQQAFAYANPSWRTGVLKEAGVPFEDLCETTYGRRSVQVSDEPLADAE